MTPNDFPILTAGYDKTLDRFRANAEAMAQRGPRLANVLNTLIAADEAGEILNPRYIKAKDEINRIVRDVYETLVRSPFLSRENRERDTAMDDLYWMGEPTMANVEGFFKKLQPLIKRDPNDDLLKTAVAYINELRPLAAIVKSLKDKVVKRVAKSEEEKREAKFTPPPSTSQAVARVRALLEEFVAESYNRLLDHIEDGIRADVIDFLKACDEVAEGTYDRRGRRPFKGSVVRFSPYDFCRFANGSVDSKTAGEIEAAVVSGVRADGQRGYIRRDDADAIIHAKAERDAQEIREVYVVKTLKKLTSIIEAKGDDNFLAVEKHGYTPTNLSYLEGSMLVKFKDGSQFTATNSVVFVVNSFNTRFLRFPLTFRNVVMPDGSPMKSPSEKRMNTVFLGK